MTKSINSQCLLKFLYKLRTCFKVMRVCQDASLSCLSCHIEPLFLQVRKGCTHGWAWLTLNQWPALYTKTSHLLPVLGIHVFTCCNRSDCQVTFRTPPLHLFLSVCHTKASLLAISFPLLLPSLAAEKQVHCDSECSSTAQWVLFEMRFEGVSMREEDREPLAALRLDE